MVRSEEVELMVAQLELAAPRFVGIRYSSAVEIAAELNVQLRIITDEPFDWDIRVNRMNIKLDGQFVIKAWAG